MEISKYSGLRVLVAGCGAIGKRHIDVLHKMGVGEIIVCDPSQAALNGIAEKYSDIVCCTDYEESLLKNPFAVFILTPTKMHIPMAVEALKNGAHVFIEKPLSNSSEGVKELKEAAKVYNRQVMVGFCFRYHEALLYAKKCLEEGKIGRLVSVRALMGEDFPSIHPEYKDMYLSKYSGAFELVHDVDLAIWFAGQNVKNVYGVYGAFSDYGFESPDTAELIMEFDEKCTASVHLDFFQNPRRRVIELIGTSGIITVDFASWDDAYIKVYTKQTESWEEKHIKTDRNDMFFDENTEFLDRTIQNVPMVCDVDEALKSLQVIEKIYKPY